MSSSLVSPAITFRHATKRYGRNNNNNNNVVLSDLNLTVPRGAIYGLLGASGSGKTTILSCIVGRRKLDSGTMSINPPSLLPAGYMPQDLALFPLLNIQETLNFFGRIQKVTEIDERISFLIRLLDLPDQDTRIENLSGGQQRRVSFAISLIRADAELLILDEPTVGVDSLLRRKIWNHLCELSSKFGKTIVITTHYIEEAKQAGVVGLLRGGKLLAEKSPREMIESVENARTLEEVFLHLCRSNKEEEEEEEGEETLRLSWWKELVKRNVKSNEMIELTDLPSSCPDAATVKTSTNSSSNFLLLSFMRIWALVCRNITTFRRSPGHMIFSFPLPAIEVICFCLAVGRDPENLNFAVVNNDNNNCSNNSRRIVLSCLFLNKTFTNDSGLIRRDFPDVDLALKAVRKGEAWGMMEVPKGFSKNFLRIHTRNMSERTPDMFESGSPRIRLDQSNQIVAQTIEMSLTKGFDRFSRTLLNMTGRSEKFADPFLFFGDPILGPENGTFTEFMAPGVILLLVFFLSMSLVSQSLISEISGGQFDRILVAGVRPAEFLFSHVITQLFLVVTTTAITLAFAVNVFGVPCRGPMVWLIGLTLLQGLTGLSYGLFLSAVCGGSQTMAVYLILGTFNPNLILSGILWPIEGMPWVLRCVAWYLPSTAACQGMRDVMARGWDVAEVWPGYVVSVSWIGIFLVASWVALKIRAK